MPLPAARIADPAARVLVVCLLAALTTFVAPTPPAHAWSDGACPDGDGITVVVDFRSLGGDTLVRCAPAPVESGYDALTRVGLDWTPTQRHPGFLCRIEGAPADDPCVNTPPPDAYWSYWRAEPGGDWRYSTYGPATTSPPPGPVEGWSFTTGSGDQPPRTPPPGTAAAEPPPPSPSPTPSPTATTAPSPEPTTAPPPPPPPPPSPEPTPAPTPSPTPDTATTQPSPTAAGPSSPRPTRTRTPAPSASATVTPSPTAAPSASETDAVTSAAVEAGGGLSANTLVAVLLVLGLGGGAALTARRRRRP